MFLPADLAHLGGCRGVVSSVFFEFTISKPWFGLLLRRDPLIPEIGKLPMEYLFEDGFVQSVRFLCPLRVGRSSVGAVFLGGFRWL